MKKIIVFLAVLCLAGCAPIYSNCIDIKMDDAIKTGHLRFGMTKDEVYNVIGKPYSEQNIHTYQDKNSIKTDWVVVAAQGSNSSWFKTYTLHFENDILKSWETHPNYH